MTDPGPPTGTATPATSASAPAATPASTPAPTPPRTGHPTQVEAFVAAQAEPVRSLLWLCRDYLHRTAPGVSEAIKWGIPAFMMERNLFYLNPKGDHVVLGFVAGAQMPEFRGVFDHVAAEVTHVYVRRAADLERPGLRDAVRAAAGFAAGERDFGDSFSAKSDAVARPHGGDNDDRLLA